MESWCLAAVGLLILCAASGTGIGSAHAQQDADAVKIEATATDSGVSQYARNENPLQPPDTSSPRATLQTFLRLTLRLEDTIGAYKKEPSRASATRARSVANSLIQLLDLENVPGSSRREIGRDAVWYLLDIIGRLDLPPIESVPDDAAFEDEEGPAKWRIPQTRITLIRVEEGPREGEFLFSKRTVELAPQFYRQISHLPLKSGLGIESWYLYSLQAHGPYVPSELIAMLPNSLKQPYLGTPIWKILYTVVLIGLAAVFLILLHFVTRRWTFHNKALIDLRHLLTPVAIILVSQFLQYYLNRELLVPTSLAVAVSHTSTALAYFGICWVFWIAARAIVDWIILSPKIPHESLDANLLRLVGRMVGFIGGVSILTVGANSLGIPILGLLAGLGIGGLAVALAIRPTLENLIGGIILFIDQPVRVGDFCTFGTNFGTVENIGLRSTQIRALDRTIITVPNSTFADMEIVNWARCDMMLIRNTIGLRYETEPDQLRYLMVKLREVFVAHPKIDNETVRVRFVGYGASSLDVEIRVYALTREWNDFYAIREDVFLRVNEIVKESGTGFAFPSQTLYLGRDDGLDAERSVEAMRQVGSWRSSGYLPFPYMPRSRREQLADTLDYPPKGSHDARHPDTQSTEQAEPLSDVTDDGESPTEPERS